jgi:RNA polymerase sigma-70 factor, ECF subfamily
MEVPDMITPTANHDDALDAQVRAFLAARPLVQSHIRALVHDNALAEDVFQELWLRFEKATRRGELIAQVPAWCRSAARLIALEAWRKQGRELATEDDALASLIDQAHAEQDDRLDHWADHSTALARCLDQLPPRSRDLITRRYQQDQPIAEIATQLGQSTGSLKTALCRLRVALADCVKKRIELSA